MMLEEQALIKDTFLVSIFQILSENPEMTATEVMERTREKGILTGSHNWSATVRVSWTAY
jgi:hypothetical protein